MDNIVQYITYICKSMIHKMYITAIMIINIRIEVGE